MTRAALDEYAAVVRRRYRVARKAEKTKILDEFCQTTGFLRPLRKLVSKQRLGARVVKRYDQPRTPREASRSLCRWWAAS